MNEEVPLKPRLDVVDVNLVGVVYSMFFKLSHCNLLEDLRFEI